MGVKCENNGHHALLILDRSCAVIKVSQSDGARLEKNLLSCSRRAFLRDRAFPSAFLTTGKMCRNVASASNFEAIVTRKDS